MIAVYGSTASDSLGKYYKQKFPLTCYGKVTVTIVYAMVMGVVFTLVGWSNIMPYVKHANAIFIPQVEYSSPSRLPARCFSASYLVYLDLSSP